MKAPYAIIIVVILLGAIGAGLLLRGGPSQPSENKSIEEIVENYHAGGGLEVDHWWTIDVEELGFNAARNGMENRYPNVSFTAVPVPGGAGGNMPAKIMPQLMAGRAPESFQSHPGYETARYLGHLRSLNDLWEYDNLAQRTPEMVSRICKIEGNYYIVPIGVHQTNIVWYNKELFEQCGVTPPSGPITFDQFWALCDELKSKLPTGKYPLDLGDGMGTPWAATHVFETIMVGLNPQTYEDFINGKVTAEQLKPVLENFKKFLSYVPDDHLARNWAEACGQLYTGRVAMYLHGDWVKGYFKNRGWQYGVQYGSFPAPGTSGLFGLCVDGFVVPSKAASLANGLRWVHSYTTEEVQKNFNLVKGSISPYKDIPLDIYEDDYSRESAQSLRNPSTKFYPSITHGIALPNDVLYDLHPKISEFVLNRDVETSAQHIAEIVNRGTYTIPWDIAP
jgi:glucose/mannose transport system substrate-binding protein